MAVSAGILDGTGVVTRRLSASVTSRRIALAWRKGSPRAAEFKMLGNALVDARTS
jgi:LysR family hydrogen peroxide-inducible transcriptional activator